MNTQIEEITVRVPKNTNKRYSVMKFHPLVNTDVTKWSNFQMERETTTDQTSKSEQREVAVARRRKTKKANYNPEAQPWIFKPDENTGKKYRGVKLDGARENSDYYVFVEVADGSFDAYPVADWHNFMAVPNYKTLNIEQAEAAFEKRHTVRNYFKVMKNAEAENEKLDGEKSGVTVGCKGSESKALKIRDEKNKSESSSDDDLETDGVTKTKKRVAKKKSKETKGKPKYDGMGDSDVEEMVLGYITDSGDEDSIELAKDEEPVKETNELDEEMEERKEQNAKEEPSAVDLMTLTMKQDVNLPPITKKCKLSEKRKRESETDSKPKKSRLN